MASWLKQSTAVDVAIGPFVDNIDGFTAESGLTITQPDVRLKKNSGNWAQKNAAQTLLHEENGWYEVALDTTDTNTLGILIVAVNESGALPVWREFMVLPANIYDSLVSGSDLVDVSVTQWLGSAAATPTVAGVPEVDVTYLLGSAFATPTVAGVPEVDVTHWIGTAAAAPTVAGVPEVDITHLLGTVFAAPATAGLPDVNIKQISTDDIAADNAELFFNGTGYSAGNSSVGFVIEPVSIDMAQVLPGVPDPASTGQALYSITRTIGAIYGQADSGTTTTLVDSSRTESAVDHWKGSWLLIHTSTLEGQVRQIAGFDPVTDTITVAPPFTTAVTSAHFYFILPGAGVDLRTWNGMAPNDLVSGRVDASVGALGANVVTAASLAADAGTEIADALLKRDMSAVTGEAARSLLNAIRKLMNKWSISGGTLTVTKEDDATTAFTQAVTSTAGAAPITALDTN